MTDFPDAPLTDRVAARLEQLQLTVLDEIERDLKQGSAPARARLASSLFSQMLKARKDDDVDEDLMARMETMLGKMSE